MQNYDANKTVHLFISPHLDDVVLSCGGYVYRLVQSGHRVIVLTLVTGDAPENAPVTFETWRHKVVWDLGALPFEGRRQEDIDSVKVLGAEFAHLGLLDGIYRCDVSGTPYYPRNTVGVPVNPIDKDEFLHTVEDALREYLVEVGENQLQVYCPLALGEHVDHVIIRDVVEGIWGVERTIYYEDYPYAQKLSRNRLEDFVNRDGAKWDSFVINLNEDEIQARIASTACHASQIPDLFMTTLQRWGEILERRIPFMSRFLVGKLDPTGAEQRMAEAIRSYVKQVGGERYWRHLE